MEPLYPLSPPSHRRCPLHLLRGVIRPQPRNPPRSGGVVLPDFHVPSVEGLSNYSSSPFHSSFLVFRLKLRCDRGIPCGSCVKRGCGAICPDGNHISTCYSNIAHDHLQVHLPPDKAIGSYFVVGEIYN